MSKEAAAWGAFSMNYTQTVFSVSLFAKKRKAILSEVIPGRILDMGCGPLTFLLQDLADRKGNRVLAADFCMEMLVVARQSLIARNIVYLVADNRALPIKDEMLDTVISVNSILPEVRHEVDSMIAEAWRVLRPSGRFLAVLPAFEMSRIAREKWGMNLQLDVLGHREYDTTGWQCFYTVGDINELMIRHRFRSYRLEHLRFDSQEEIDHIRTVYPSLRQLPVYGPVEYPLFEHFIIAEK